MPTARQEDINGFVSIAQNPISREGVFPYLGKNIDDSLEPDTVYWVYRPATELIDPECLNSFALLPIIDDHEMLGRESDGLTPAEKKGVHGTTGADVAFRDGVLYSDIKFFSESILNEINSGKKDLSLGYRCEYDYAPGSFAGTPYTHVQRSLRGNHLALVEKARCNVAVLDGHKITMDHLDIKQEEPTKMPMTLDQAEAAITETKSGLAAITSALDGLTKQVAALAAKTAADADEDKDDKKAEDEDDKDKKAEDADEDEKKAEDEDDKDDKKDKAMDAMEKQLRKTQADLKKVTDSLPSMLPGLLKQVQARDNLAKQISSYVGVFDHSDMTIEQVAKYGVEKLKLTCDSGAELAFITGYLHNRPDPTAEHAATAMDAAPVKPGSLVAGYLNPVKA